MENPQKPRLEPRMIFAVVLVAIPLLYVVGQVILFRAGEDCGDPDHSQVGGLAQLFIPGDACPQTPPAPPTP
ncbi:MAG TPA: hypothetical protein VLB29_06365 [Nocardioidaceae bacterium]|nr:hypothetical protein [Nocardioidaceae bacterium]